MYNDSDAGHVSVMRFKHNNMRNSLFAGAALGVLAFCLFSAWHPALAQDMTEQLASVGASSGLPTANVAIIVARIIRIVLGTLGIIFTIVIIYAGFLFLTAQGDVDKVKTAKKMITNGVIGMIICILSFSIAQFVLSRLLIAAGIGGSVTSMTANYSEPLSGSLGAGVIEWHYPERFALDVPRNARISVKFKEPISPASLISGYDANPASTDLNTDNVLVYPTDAGEGSKLFSTQAVVTMSTDHTSVSIDPVPLLGDGVNDMNYTVVLSNAITLDEGGSAFTGSYSGGYEWTFEVSTELDMTPPQVVSVVPSGSSSNEARNVTVTINFDEAMDPVAATGTYVSGASGNFENIEMFDEDERNVEGTFSISNGFKTVEFTPAQSCGEDPCGDTIYCLPGNEDLSAEAHAASLGSDPPQAADTVSVDGLVDASGNSLDGDGDGEAQGSATDDVDGTDDYDWSFGTTDEINDTVPEITSITPGILDTFADQDADITIAFNMQMRSDTLNSTNISLWPDPWYEFWFTVGKSDVMEGDSVDHTVATIGHPTMVSSDDKGWTYHPVVTRGVKSNWQICMFPSSGPDAEGTGTCDVDNDRPYCCDGVSSDTACSTGVSGIDLPDTTE